MNGFGYTLRAFAGDLVPTVVFLLLVLATRNVVLAMAMGLALGVIQLIVTILRRAPVGALQWVGLGLTAVLGGASLVTRDARFIMLKPTLIHVVVGAAMLRRGWMERYASPETRDLARPLMILFGYVWAGLMFALAALNLVLAATADPSTWARFNLVGPPVAMVFLFTAQNLYMRLRIRAQVRARA